MSDNNTGKENTGDCNSGYCNSGDRNSGDWNSGNRNSGNRNSGYCNSGYCNSGYWNSGYWNSGNRNSGNRNSGNCNSGYWNSGDCNSARGSNGAFCTKEPKILIFDKESDLTLKEWQEQYASLFYDMKLTEWISEDDMTNEEKVEQAEFHVRGGYLKTYEYKEAWANWWSKCDDEKKKKVQEIPNFNSTTFKEITGIDVGKEDENSTKKKAILKKIEELKTEADKL